MKRALDSTPLFDAVATQDTVTLVRSAIRGLLGACSGELQRAVRAALSRDDDYAAAGKPPCDWDDPQAREQLVDALVCDGYAALGVLEGRELSGPVAEAGELLATVVGQDIEQRADGTFAIARRVAADRVIPLSLDTRRCQPLLGAPTGTASTEAATARPTTPSGPS